MIIKINDGDIEPSYIDDSFSYVNRFYGRDFKKNDSVLALGRKGVALGGTHYVYVEHEDGSIEHYHPDDVEQINQKDKSE